MSARPRISPKAVVRDWIAAFNAGDHKAIAELYAEKAVNHQVMFEPVTGQDAIRDMFRREFAALKMTCIPESLFQDGDWAILEWRDPQGLRGCGFFHVVDGRIQTQRGYWDRQSLKEKHGVEA